jgi:aminopeptidase N
VPDRKPETKHLADYRPSPFLIDHVALVFDLGEEFTTVAAKLTVRRNPDPAAPRGPLVLDGVEIELIGIRCDGRELDAGEYTFDGEGLTLPDPADAFTLETEGRIKPQGNTSLEGLFASGDNFCTQCEAEGFRKITFFPDRPDVMARYSVRIVADREIFPVLLSNGNLVEEGPAGEGRHFACWEDPFPKPSYLFALVAGKLVCLEDRFVTKSGREVTLRIWVREADLDRTDHAMASLKKAMKWDEEVYGLEYDLDIFNIVAVDDFNMGAMENKSLNIFNSKSALARRETATDNDFITIEAVIAHEYFHNWTGNRVTLSSWFHLSLKEGLTVFRDQCFTADVNSAAVERIDSVSVLRSSQFPEDAGPMAHPIRPPSYIEMNNFYTATVYEKGAEVIRMIHTLIGPERYREGIDLYFERHDGLAVTTGDFVAAMEDASGVDLAQFRLWYDQAGTPTLKVSREFDGDARSLTLKIEQTVPDTPGSKDKKPMHIPLAMALLDRRGREMPLRLEGDTEVAGGETEIGGGDTEVAGGSRVLNVRRREETFRFVGLSEEPVPSLLRGFSAPVYLKSDLSREELSFLLANDTDSFNRWEAGQELARGLLLDLTADAEAGRELKGSPLLSQAFRGVLKKSDDDPALAARALVLPGEKTLAEFVDIVDPGAIHKARGFLRRTLGAELRDDFVSIYEKCASPSEGMDSRSMGMRALRNACLIYIATQKDDAAKALVLDHYKTARNMTDTVAALHAFADWDCPERGRTLADFYEKWRGDTLVLDKWLILQAVSSLPGVLDEVKRLSGHEAFEIRNPNRVRSLLMVFALRNQIGFHGADGAAYVFTADRILELDKLNPQVAARLAGCFNQWVRFDAGRRSLMKEQLEKVVAVKDLSPNVYEIVSKALAMEEGVSGGKQASQ